MIKTALLILMLSFVGPASAFAQFGSSIACPPELLNEKCSANRGLDLSGVGPCDYFTRGRPEYTDLCCQCDSRSCYLSLLGGIAAVENLEREQEGLTPDRVGTSLAEGGYFGGAIGKRWNSRMRAEVEFSYLNNNAQDWFEQTTVGNVINTTRLPANGQVENYVGMANALFDITERRTLDPNVYLGAGVGLLHSQGSVTTAMNQYQVHDASFAWQFILGGSYALQNNTELFTEYRYLLANQITVDDPAIASYLGDFQLRTHNVALGIRFAF